LKKYGELRPALVTNSPNRSTPLASANSMNSAFNSDIGATLFLRNLTFLQADYRGSRRQPGVEEARRSRPVRRFARRAGRATTRFRVLRLRATAHRRSPIRQARAPDEFAFRSGTEAPYRESLGAKRRDPRAVGRIAGQDTARLPRPRVSPGPRLVSRRGFAGSQYPEAGVETSGIRDAARKKSPAERTHRVRIADPATRIGLCVRVVPPTAAPGARAPHSA
jgi:hypothetical protein